MKESVRIWFVIFLIMIPMTRTFGLPPGKPAKNVLLINSYQQGHLWTDSLNSGINKSLKLNPEINLYIKNLDTKKFEQSKFEVEKQYIQDKYSGIPFDGVLVTDNDALDFAFKYKSELFPNAPVVFAGISNPEDYPLENSDFYGFSETFDVEGMVSLVKLLLPNSKKLLVIVDQTTTGKIFREKLVAYQTRLKGFTILLPADIDEDSICSLCSQTPGLDAVYYFNINQDKYGRAVNNTQLFERIEKVTPVPVFSDEPTFLGKGVVGGLYQSGIKQGSEAIKLLIRIINSTNRQSFSRINKTDQAYFFDRTELDRFGISKERLPEGSFITNEKEIFSKSNFKALVATMLILVMAVVILSVVNRRRRVAQRRSKIHLDKIEAQKNELQVAHQKLSEVISELESANTRLNESNVSLLEAKKKAEESDKLKSAFLANVSHEIRTPLNSIVGFTSLLIEPGLDEETRASYIDLVESNTESLLVLIDEIIDLSKIEAQQLSINKQQFSVDLLISELYQIFIRDKKNKNVELVTRKVSETKELMLNSDRVRVRQVFINLLSNAFKFTDSGTIEFGYFFTEENDIVLYVKDTGIGISKEFHQAIFHRFRKLNENTGKVFRGTGLGLAITQKLVEILGGKIWVESELGKGSAFYFTLEGLILNDLNK